jgi:hypothetical protein
MELKLEARIVRVRFLVSLELLQKIAHDAMIMILPVRGKTAAYQPISRILIEKLRWHQSPDLVETPLLFERTLNLGEGNNLV